MDHKFAEVENSVEKYMLDELSTEERTEFEEHMFDCPHCSELVRQNFTAVANLKEVLRDERLTAGEPSEVRRGAWRDLLRWPSLVPTMAALAMACFIGYQNLSPAPALMSQVLPAQMEPLRTASRGAMPALRLDPKSSLTVILLNGDQLPPGPFQCELENASGTHLLGPLDGTKAADIDLISVPIPTKRLPTGVVKLILQSKAKPDELKSFAFTVSNPNPTN